MGMTALNTLRLGANFGEIWVLSLIFVKGNFQKIGTAAIPLG